jgi:hypothetical protein
MASVKEIRREVSDFWKLLKQERKARSKLEGAADLAESARRLAQLAEELEKLSGRVAWHELKANQPTKPKKKKTATATDSAKQTGKLPPKRSRKSSVTPEKLDEQKT